MGLVVEDQEGEEVEEVAGLRGHGVEGRGRGGEGGDGALDVGVEHEQELLVVLQVFRGRRCGGGRHRWLVCVGAAPGAPWRVPCV